MTHADHGHHDTTVVERDGSGVGAGVMLGIATILLLAIIGLALLFTQPWDDDGDAGLVDPVPGINEGGGTGEGTGEGTGGGTDECAGGGTDEGAGGGEGSTEGGQ